MEITKVYWREDALNNMKDILVSHHRQGGKVIKRIIEEITKNIELLKKRPYLGYYESSMAGQPQKIYSHLFTHKNIKVLYYMENNTLYIIDFWDA